MRGPIASVHVSEGVSGGLTASVLLALARLWFSSPGPLVCTTASRECNRQYGLPLTSAVVALRSRRLGGSHECTPSNDRLIGRP